MDGIDATQVGPLALTSHELIYILGMHDTAASHTSRRVLELVQGDEAREPGLYGATTLLARDLASVRESRIVLGREAGLVSMALSQADIWVRAAVLRNDVATVLVVPAGERISVLMQGRTLGIYDVTPLRHGVDIPAFVTKVVGELSRDVDEGFLCSAQLLSGSGSSAAVSVAVDTSGVMASTDDTDEMTRVSSAPMDREAAMQTIATALGRHWRS